jgi:hypothetical protein
MGKRARHRSAEPRDHVARVRVSDDIWDEFRASADAETIGQALGRLVERAVEKQRSAQLRRGGLDDKDLVEALERATQLRDDVAKIVERLERRLDGGDRPPRATWGQET